MKYTKEMCDIVPSSESAKYRCGNKPNPHKTSKLWYGTQLCPTDFTQIDAKFSFSTMTGWRELRGSFSPNILEALSDLEEGATRRAKKLEVSVEEAGLEQSWGMV